MSFSSSESHDSSSAILVSNRNGAHPHNQPHDPIPGHYTQSRAGAPMFRDIIETLHELVAEEVPTENVLSVACLRLLIGETYFEHQAPPYLEEYKFRLATHNWDIVIQHRGEQTQEVIRIMKKFIKQSEELRHASGRPRIQRTISIAPSNPLVHQSLKGGFYHILHEEPGFLSRSLDLDDLEIQDTPWKYTPREDILNPRVSTSLHDLHSPNHVIHPLYNRVWSLTPTTMHGQESLQFLSYQLKPYDVPSSASTHRSASLVGALSERVKLQKLRIRDLLPSDAPAEIPDSAQFTYFTSSLVKQLAPFLTELEFYKIRVPATLLQQMLQECLLLRKISFKHLKEAFPRDEHHAFPRHIETLSLIDCGFTDHSEVYHLIADGTSDQPRSIGHSNLTHLDISGNKKMRSKGIGNWLPCTLQYLNLSHCLQDEHPDLRNLCQLRHFIWRGIRLSNPDLSNFLHLSQLRCLDFRGRESRGLLSIFVNDLPEGIHLAISSAIHQRHPLSHVETSGLKLLKGLMDRKISFTVEMDICHYNPQVLLVEADAVTRSVILHQEDNVFVFDQCKKSSRDPNHPSRSI